MEFFASPSQTPKASHDTQKAYQERETISYSPGVHTNAVQQPSPMYIPNATRPRQDFFNMSPSPPGSVFSYGYVSSSAPSSSTPLDDDRPTSPFIISNDMDLSSSPTDALMPELNSFYVKDKHGHRILALSPSTSPPSPQSTKGRTTKSPVRTHTIVFTLTHFMSPLPLRLGAKRRSRRGRASCSFQRSCLRRPKSRNSEVASKKRKATKPTSRGSCRCVRIHQT